MSRLHPAETLSWLHWTVTWNKAWCDSRCLNLIGWSRYTRPWSFTKHFSDFWGTKSATIRHIILFKWYSPLNVVLLAKWIPGGFCCCSQIYSGFDVSLRAWHSHLDHAAMMQVDGNRKDKGFWEEKARRWVLGDPAKNMFLLKTNCVLKKKEVHE